MTFSWPWPKVRAVASISKDLPVCMIKWEKVYCPSRGYYLIRFWRSSGKNCYFGKFSLKIPDMFFKVKHYFGHISGMDGPIDMKQKGKCISWILSIICNLDLWPHLWPSPWMFQGQILKYLYLRNCWSDWCETNRILGRLYDLAFWPYTWPWPWSLKVRVSNSLTSGTGWPIDMERKRCELSIDHDID